MLTVSARFGLAFALAVALVTSAAAGAHAQTVTATTSTGPVTGVVGATVDSFRGIPYAAPPVGPLRWQPPQPHASWTTPIDASVVGPHCAQIASPFGQPSQSEDCLYLNVYTPHRKSLAARDLNRNRPVMVWIHGGAFILGESDEYDATKLVTDGDVVVVTLNYRIGILGFLAHPALSAESPDNVSGNYGILDQQFALQWVQQNIAAFGGNPHRVTIFGESAGGLSVHAQLASPGADGLFQRAIVESGAFFTQPTLATAEQQGNTFANDTGCSDQTAACLRALSVQDILSHQGTGLGAASPNIDGVVLPQPILTAYKNGDFARVPVIEGSNRNEMRLFVALFFDLMGGPIADDQYGNAIQSLLGVPSIIVPTLMSKYPLANYPSADLALSAMGTDAAFACGASAATRALAPFTKTYQYEFADEDAPELFLPPVSFPYGASHASEIQYLFSVPAEVPAPPLTPDQEKLSDTMVQYWTRFARGGVPSAPHVTKWPRYKSDSQTPQLLSLVPPTPAPLGSAQFHSDHQCGFWDGLLGF